MFWLCCEPHILTEWLPVLSIMVVDRGLAATDANCNIVDIRHRGFQLLY